MSPILTILHPTDFSESAEAAFSLATVLARQHGARIIVLHVYPPPLSHAEAVARREGNGYEADLWRLLDHYVAPDPNTRVEYRLVEGGPTAEIVRIAEEENCDLIVMGTHGRSGLARLVMGSVADGVSRGATGCPVLTVRIPLLGKPPRKEVKKELTAV